jgi:hypothetical protein
MKPNIGTLDRALRISAGLLLLVLASAGTIGAWGFLGVIPLATGLVSVCPLYSILGMHT